MKNVIEIEINENLCSYIESKMYEVNARKDLIAYALSMNVTIDTEAFKQYQKEFVDFKREYDIAVNEMIEKIINPIVKEKNIGFYNYSVDFTRNVVVITYGD